MKITKLPPLTLYSWSGGYGSNGNSDGSSGVGGEAESRQFLITNFLKDIYFNV